MRSIVGAAACLAAVSMLSAAYANGEHVAGGLEHGHMWGYGAGGMIFGTLMMVLVIAAIITLVVLLVRWLTGAARAPHAGPPAKPPLDILEERFARGEIDKAEFEERKRVLGA